MTEISPGKEIVAFVEPKAVADFVREIEAAWRQSIKGILTVAELCARARRELSASERKLLFGRLPFDEPTFSKLAKIGDDPRFLPPAVQLQLPSHYTILYLLSGLTDSEFDRAVVEEIIHPDLKRAEFENWRKSVRQPSGSADQRSSVGSTHRRQNSRVEIVRLQAELARANAANDSLRADLSAAHSEIEQLTARIHQLEEEKAMT